MSATASERAAGWRDAACGKGVICRPYDSTGWGTIWLSGGGVYGGTWSLIKARKPGVCPLSGLPIAKGDEVYRPLTLGKHRGVHIHKEAIFAKI